MSDLTDLEICKRIAEIECEVIEHIYRGFLTISRTGDIYNPLAKTEAGKALCFDLMVKHDIRLSRNKSGDFVALYSHCRGVDCQNPQAAICLAIIEKHRSNDK